MRKRRKARLGGKERGRKGKRARGREGGSGGTARQGKSETGITTRRNKIGEDEREVVGKGMREKEEMGN